MIDKEFASLNKKFKSKATNNDNDNNGYFRIISLFQNSFMVGSIAIKTRMKNVPWVPWR